VTATPVHAAYMTGFQVNNTTTSYVLSLNRVTGDGSVESAPPVAAGPAPASTTATS